MAKTATYRQARDAASRWATVVLVCRTRGHAWDQTNARQDGKAWDVSFRCLRECGCTKTEIWDSRGRIVRSRMHYPKDADGELYLSPIGRLDADARGALRLTILDR